MCIRDRLSPASYRPREEYGSVWPSVESRDGCVATEKLWPMAPIPCCKYAPSKPGWCEREVWSITAGSRENSFMISSQSRSHDWRAYNSESNRTGTERKSSIPFSMFPRWMQYLTPHKHKVVCLDLWQIRKQATQHKKISPLRIPDFNRFAKNMGS